MARNDTTLFSERCLVDGEWIAADSGATIAVTDPATGETIGQVPDLAPPEIERAIAAAEAAQREWRTRTAADRGAILMRWHRLIMDHQDELAALMTREQGKPHAEAAGEVAYAASFVEWFAEEGKRLYGDTVPAPKPELRITVLKQPVGVCAAITPWNFPAAMIMRKAAPALAAGCSMIVRPAELTPFTALALGVLAAEAGVPAGVLQVVTGQAEPIGETLCASETVRKLSFTGSTRVGRLLMAQCAPTLKRLSLELGGNAPFIVFDDADLDAAVAGAIASKYRNAGQTCVCANRLLVQDGIHDAFVERLCHRVAELRIGPGSEAGVAIGPLISQAAVEKVEAHIADARSHGADVALGGERHELGGTFFQPTVLTGVTPAMRVSREETFGPMAPVYRFAREDEAVAMANDTVYGLAAYFYTRDHARSVRVAEALEYGMVGHNTGMISNAVAPFGGIKQSGFGREGSRYGIDEYLELKYLCSAIGE